MSDIHVIDLTDVEEDPHSAPPEWAQDLEYDVPVPTMPDFASPRWFRSVVQLSPTNIRRLRETLEKSRSLNKALIAWFPPTARLDRDNLFWFVASAAMDVQTMDAMVKVVRQKCKPARMRQASFFEAFHIVKASDPECIEDAEKGSRIFREIAFLTILEQGRDQAVTVTEAFLDRPDTLTMEDQRFFDWIVARYPDLTVEFDALQQRRADRGIEVAALHDATVELEKARRERTEAIEKSEAIRGEMEHLNEDLNDLTFRHAELQREIAAVRAGHDPRAARLRRPAGYPSTLEDVMEWIETDLAPTVHVLPKAFRSLRRCPEVDIPRLVKGLTLLRDVYPAWRAPHGPSDQDYRRLLAEAGYEETSSFSSDDSLDVFPGYVVRWGNRTIRLDRHLKRGVGSVAQGMIRIYFHWDPETRTAIVGHMPSHLRNWLS